MLNKGRVTAVRAAELSQAFINFTAVAIVAAYHEAAIIFEVITARSLLD